MNRKDSIEIKNEDGSVVSLSSKTQVIEDEPDIIYK